MFERCGYRAALCLSALIAAVNWSVFIYVQRYMPPLADGSVIYAVGATLVFVGIWLQSRIARYAGAIFYFLSAGVFAYALWGVTQVNVGTVWAVTLMVLGLAGASILIFSKSFSREFAVERENRPPYKKYLLHAFTFVIISVAAAGALVDIVTFFKMMSAK